MKLLPSRPSGPPDGRKYRMAFLFAGLMVLGLLLAGRFEIIKDLYSEFVTGLGILYFTYCTGNVGNKWVLGKHGALQAQMGTGEPEPEEPEETEPPAGKQPAP
jgi:predicted outer membrane lipoprotein